MIVGKDRRVDVGMTLPSMVAEYDRETTLRWCRRIDDGPYASLAVGERVTFRNQEQLVLLSAAAALTERVRIVSTIVVAGLHAPGLVAKRMATLDVLSAGRLDVGLGVGSRSHDFAAAERPFDRRPSRLEAFAGELRRLWSGEAPFAGADPIGPPPVRPGGPPLFCSSYGPRSLASGGRWADGQLGFTFAADPRELERAADSARAAWDAAGRATPPRLVTSAWVSLGAGAAARHRAYAEAYLGIEPAALPLVDHATVVGDDALAKALDAAEAAGFDEFLVVPTTTDEAELDRIEVVLGRR